MSLPGSEVPSDWVTSYPKGDAPSELVLDRLLTVVDQALSLLSEPLEVAAIPGILHDMWGAFEMATGESEIHRDEYRATHARLMELLADPKANG